MPTDRQRSRRGWSLLLGPLFFTAAGFLYNFSGMGRHATSGWSYTHRARIGSLPISMSDYYFLTAIFCGICGVVYFVLCTVARRLIEILFGYTHFLLSVGTIAVVPYYIDDMAPSDPLEPIPSLYWTVFSLAQILFLIYVAMAVFSPPPEDQSL